MSQQSRFNATTAFVTFSQCPIMLAVLMTKLREKLGSRQSAISISGFSACREAHQDGGYHVHILMKFVKKIDVKGDADFMDVEVEGVIYHPNIQKVVNFNASKNYMRKDYKENIKQAIEAGFLIEEWPETMASDGRKRKATIDDHPNIQKGVNFNASKNYVRKDYKENDGRKRKAAFDEEEFKEDFKRARSAVEFIGILREKNPLALAQNYNNFLKFAEDSYPAVQDNLLII